MRIVRVSAADRPTYGVLEEGSSRIIGLTGDPLFQQVDHSGQFFDLNDVRVLAPVLPRSKVLVLDPVHFGADIAEQDVAVIPNTAVAGPDDPVLAPSWASTIEVEAAVAIIVKSLLKDVRPEAARQLVLGTCLLTRYRCANAQSGAASVWDRSCPLGPWIEVMGDADPHTDAIAVQVGNREVEWEPRPWRIEDAVARASSLATLLPGDIIAVPWPGRLSVEVGQHVTLTHGRLGQLHSVLQRG